MELAVKRLVVFLLFPVIAIWKSIFIFFCVLFEIPRIRSWGDILGLFYIVLIFVILGPLLHSLMILQYLFSPGMRNPIRYVGKDLFFGLGC